MRKPELSHLILATGLATAGCQSDSETKYPETTESQVSTEAGVTSSVSITRHSTREVTGKNSTQPENLASLDTRLRLMACIGNAPLGTPGLMVKSTGRQFNFTEQSNYINVHMEGATNGKERLNLFAKVNGQPVPSTETLLGKAATECESAVKKVIQSNPITSKDPNMNGSKSSDEDKLDINLDIELPNAKLESNINTLFTFGSEAEQNALADCTIEKKATRPDHGEFCMDDSTIKTCVTVDQIQAETENDRSVYQVMDIKVRPSKQLGKKVVPRQDIIQNLKNKCEE